MVLAVFTYLIHFTILGVSWKDKVTNEEVRARTGQQSFLNTLSGRRLCWLGHTIRMDHHTSSTILGGPRFQEGIRSAKDKLERYSQERSARNGTHLGRGGGGSSRSDKNGVRVWPNTFTWTWDESSQVNIGILIEFVVTSYSGVVRFQSADVCVEQVWTQVVCSEHDRARCGAGVSCQCGTAAVHRQRGPCQVRCVSDLFSRSKTSPAVCRDSWKTFGTVVVTMAALASYSTDCVCVCVI